MSLLIASYFAIAWHGSTYDTLADSSSLVQGPCPECGTEATTYFGDIFTVKGPRVDNTVTCSNCKASINVNAEKRSVSCCQTKWHMSASPGSLHYFTFAQDHLVGLEDESAFPTGEQLHCIVVNTAVHLTSSVQQSEALAGVQMIISGMPNGKDDSGKKKGSSNGSKGNSKAKGQASPA